MRSINFLLSYYLQATVTSYHHQPTSMETSRLSTHNWQQVPALMTASESIPGCAGGLAVKVRRLLSSGSSSNDSSAMIGAMAAAASRVVAGWCKQ